LLLLLIKMLLHNVVLNLTNFLCEFNGKILQNFTTINKLVKKKLSLAKLIKNYELSIARTAVFDG